MKWQRPGRRISHFSGSGGFFLSDAISTETINAEEMWEFTDGVWDIVQLRPLVDGSRLDQWMTISRPEFGDGPRLPSGLLGHWRVSRETA